MSSIKSEFTTVEPEKLDEVCKYFKELGCCDYCALRFTGASETKTFMNYEKSKNDTKDSNDDSLEDEIVRKKVKLNPCLACLGITQPSFFDDAANKIIEGLKEEGYESSTFNLTVTLPIAYQIRAQSLWYHIVEKFPHCFTTLFPIGSVTIGAKDLIKWFLAPDIQQKTSMRFEPKSDFIINLTIDYKDDSEECFGLMKLFPERLKSNGKRGGGGSNISRKAVEDKFTKSLCEDDFRLVFPVPPTLPNSYACLHSVSFSHKSLYIAGRYCKLSRCLPQTPWLVGNERKMDSSVQEKITGQMETLFKSIVSRFGASGREDVDTRMLGRGRPFTVELINPKRTKMSFQMMRELENDINKQAQGQIMIRDLQIVPKMSLIDLKRGEESKCKLYKALCVVSKGCSEKLVPLTKMFPLVLDQMTPIRVLHRRPVALRKRTIHAITVTPLPSSVTPLEGSELVVVELRTQAGTYVKEFIHGDLGRTRPSLPSLAQIPFTDIIALDVMNIELDWPPSVVYTDKLQA